MTRTGGVCSAPLRMYSMSEGTRSTPFVLLQAVRGGMCARGNIAARPPVVCAFAVRGPCPASGLSRPFSREARKRGLPGRVPALCG